MSVFVSNSIYSNENELAFVKELEVLIQQTMDHAQPYNYDLYSNTDLFGTNEQSQQNGVEFHSRVHSNYRIFRGRSSIL